MVMVIIEMVMVIIVMVMVIIVMVMVIIEMRGDSSYLVNARSHCQPGL